MRFSFRLFVSICLLLVVLLTLFVVRPANSKASSSISKTLDLHKLVVPRSVVSNLGGPNSHRVNFTSPTRPGPQCTPSCGTGDLQYNQGPVQLRPKAYLIFWGPYWKSSSGAADSKVVKNYFSDVSGTNFENILTQYSMKNQNGTLSYIPNTVQFASKTQVWSDFSKPPSDNTCGSSVPTIQDTSIRAEITKAIKTKGWPLNNINTTYFVYTPSGSVINWKNISGGGCTNSDGTCGYHYLMNSSTIYAEMVYPGGPNSACQVPVHPNGNNNGDILTNTSSHEQFEATTDPDTTGGWRDGGGYEIGDKCGFNFSAGETKLNNKGVFEIQTEYSNASSSCVKTLTTVTTTTDIAPPCSASAYSLRCAITQANIDGSGDSIRFLIPSSDSGCKLTSINGQSVYVCTISPTSGFPQLLASHITINGYTQTGAQKNTLALGSGDNAIITIRVDGAKGGGIVLGGNASYDTVEGLEVTSFSPYGILLYPSSVTNNTIIGNFVGTDGTNALGNGTGIYIASGSSNNVVGGETPDSANLISGNSGQGVVIGAGGSNTIEGNYIGTDTSGKAALHGRKGIHIPNPLSSSGVPNGSGISVFAGASNNLIGGIVPAAANIISHNTDGITSGGSTNTNIIGNTISSNYIGIQAYAGETGDSIAQNSITANTDAGIQVGNSSTDATHVSIHVNSISANGGLGIDLYPLDIVNCSGPTSGAPNDYTPCPVISRATTTQVSGTACAGCTVEVYAATNEVDDQGHGEGQTFINSTTADSSGNWAVSVTLSSGQWITATAITPSSPGPAETSEFAANVAVSNTGSGGNIWITGHDADYHCSFDGSSCHYLLVATTFVMNGSTLPILALDHGSEVATAISDAFGSSAPTVDTVDPRTGFASVALVDSNGKPLYSAIIIASDTTCVGCDNNDGYGVTPDSDAINARAADIQTFFNAGGGILALAGADNYAVFYNFLPIQATGATTTSPYTLTALGLSLGLIEGQDDNCCATHNSFQLPSSGNQFQVAETDTAGLAETMIVQNGTAVAWKRPAHSRSPLPHEPRN